MKSGGGGGKQRAPSIDLPNLAVLGGNREANATLTHRFGEETDGTVEIFLAPTSAEVPTRVFYLVARRSGKDENTE